MNVQGIVKIVGSALLASHPLGLAALPIINAFLPDDKKLSNAATGTDAGRAIDTLAPELKQQLSLAEINLEVEQERGRTARYEAMCKADGQQTRAKMANKAINWLIFLSLVFVLAVAYVYGTKGAEAAFSYEMAAVFLTVSGTFTYVVRAYFGDLRTETTSRHALADDKLQSPKGLAGLYQAIKGR